MNCSSARLDFTLAHVATAVDKGASDTENTTGENYLASGIKGDVGAWKNLTKLEIIPGQRAKGLEEARTLILICAPIG